MQHSTIAAIATAPGAGGIAIVRLSGPESYEVAAKVFRPANPAKKVADAKGYTAMFCHDREVKQTELHRLETTSIKLADLRAAAPEGAELGEIGGTAIELMRRPYINYELVAKVIGRGEGVTTAMAQRIETEIRYAGYIAREERIIRDIQRHENVKIPEDFDYAPIETMTLESREKLAKIRPRTLAQAGRIPGVSPSDLAQLSIVLLKQNK